MTDEMTPKEIHKITIQFLLNIYITEIFPKKKGFVLNVRKLISSIYSPSELDSFLEEAGWERLDFETNGWQQDTWYHYSHPDYDFQLTMEYSGFYGDLRLYRRDIDD